MKTLVMVLAVCAAGCMDPTVADAVAALGGETPGIRRGPTHRAGQPCLVCHSSDGAGNTPYMSLAGTIYQRRDKDIPAPGATVQITDATGTTRYGRANCAGTFYFTENDWTPVFPLDVVVNPGEPLEQPMLGKVSREGSCSHCHVAPASADSPGQVFVDDDPKSPDWPPRSPQCGGGD